MAEVGVAFLSIVPSLRGFGSALEKQAAPQAAAAGKAAGSRFGSSFKGAFGALAVTGAATAFVGFMGDSSRAASDLNQTMSKSRAIFGAQSREIAKFGSTAARNLGLSKQQAIAAAAGFGDMFRQIGFSGTAAAGMSKKILTLSADLGAFNDVPTAEVTDMISAAFRGEFDSLQRVIPNINAARVEQVALAKTGKTAAKSLTAQEKAAATLAIVQKDGARAAGAFAKEAGSQSGASQTARASLENLKASIGQSLTPALANLAKVATPAFDWMSKHQGTMTAVAAVIGGLLAGAFIAWTGSIIAANIALLANPITWIIAAIIALIAAVVLIVKHWDLIKAKTTAVWNSIKASLARVWDSIKTKVTSAWNSIKTAISNAWDAIKNAVTTRAKQLLTFVTGLAKSFLNAYLFLPKKMLQIGTDIVLGLRDGIAKAWHWVTDKVEELIAKIPLAIRKLMGIASPSKVMMKLGASISEGLMVGIESNADAIQSSLAGLTSDLSMTARVSARTGLGVTGPSTGGGASTRPIVANGNILGWVKEFVDGRAELVLNKQLVATPL